MRTRAYNTCNFAHHHCPPFIRASRSPRARYTGLLSNAPTYAFTLPTLHTHIHTYIHTYTHTHVHVHVHTHTQTHTHKQTNTHTHNTCNLAHHHCPPSYAPRSPRTLHRPPLQCSYIHIYASHIHAPTLHHIHIYSFTNTYTHCISRYHVPARYYLIAHLCFRAISEFCN